MAPLICRVVDIFGIGVKGVHVFLECRDEFYKCVARLDAVTGDDGWICAWLPAALPLDGEVELQIMDTADFPRVSMTFIPQSQATAPWLSIRADLYLARIACHGIILHLEASPRLEYLTHSTTSSTQRKPCVAPQSRNLQTPSPFQLPLSAIAPPPSSNVAASSESEVTGGIAAENFITRKRKSEAADGEELRATRRRLV